MTPLLLAAALAAATVSAAGHHLPISSVTVFNDRARVVREGDLPVAGAAKVEVALLPDSAELSSVRLEARGAEVKQVALEHVDSDDFSEPEARRALALLDELDDRIALATREHAALQAELDEVQARHPVAPQPDLRGPAPKLNPGAWTQLAQFLAGTEENLQRRSREAIRRIDDLNRQREKAAADARAIGAGRRRTGTQVIAQLAGNGAAHLTLTYSIRGAAWKPSWQLAFDPASETVTARLDGLVRQTTGEEWTRARLTLSTAVPGAFTALPELRSWRIGERERFQPVSSPRAPLPQPPRPLRTELIPPPDEAREESARLRQSLLERASTLSEVNEGEDDVRETRATGAGKNKTSLGMISKQAKAPAVSKEQLALVPYGRSGRNFDSVLTATPDAKADSYGVALNGSGSPEEGTIVDGVQANDPALAAAPAPPPLAPRSTPASADLELALAPTVDIASTSSKSARRAGPAPTPIGFAPPAAWRAPDFGPDSAISLAGGYDLAFSAASPLTLESDRAERRVPLVAQRWPVEVEREVFPALAEQAWLVGKLTVPAGGETLPGGDAQLFSGADPAGHARLATMSPGQEVRLPLGVDRAIQPKRIVDQVQSEHGLLSKSDVDDYAVTIELANPYSHPIALRVFDQLPKKGNQDVEVELLSTSPAIAPDKDSGQLEWQLKLGPHEKTKLAFGYRIQRPKGARMHQ